MRIALFDWTEGGHHALYLRSAARSVARWADVVVGAPAGSLAVAGELPGATVTLPDARPPTDHAAPLAPQNKRFAEAELDRLEAFARETPHDQLVHLYADPVIRRLVARPPLPRPLTLLVFFARAHYPRTYGSPLSAGERAGAAFLELNVRRFRRRPDAHAVMTLDPLVAERWGRRRGAPAFWFPEPPAPVPPAAAQRRGCVLYGALAARKGIDRLAAAVAPGMPVTLAGAPEPGYASELERLAGAMRAAGAEVTLLARRLDDTAGAALLAEHRCVVLPYPRHHGMSRLVLEAAAAGTPIVAHAHGLLGDLVRRHGLGVTVDTADAAALREALVRFTERDDEVRARRDALAAFAARYAPEVFDRALAAPFQ